MATFFYMGTVHIETCSRWWS